MKIGAKIGLEKTELAKRLAKEYDFIEIYFSHNPNLNIAEWPKNIRYTMHTPHNGQGVNIALPRKNAKLDYTLKSIELAEKFKCKYAVIHPGLMVPKASVSNMIKNLKEATEFATQRKIKLLLETVPDVPNDNRTAKHTISMPNEYKGIIDKIGCGFCMDFSHATAAAAHHKQDYKSLILEFLEKIPTNYFHLYNTKTETPWDEHYHFTDKQGNMDMEFCISLIKKNDLVVFELPEPQMRNYLNAKKYLQKRGAY